MGSWDSCADNLSSLWFTTITHYICQQRHRSLKTLGRKNKKWCKLWSEDFDDNPFFNTNKHLVLVRHLWEESFLMDQNQENCQCQSHEQWDCDGVCFSDSYLHRVFVPAVGAAGVWTVAHFSSLSSSSLCSSVPATSGPFTPFSQQPQGEQKNHKVKDIYVLTFSNNLHLCHLQFYDPWSQLLVDCANFVTRLPCSFCH